MCGAVFLHGYRLPQSPGICPSSQENPWKTLSKNIPKWPHGCSFTNGWGHPKRAHGDCSPVAERGDYIQWNPVKLFINSKMFFNKLFPKVLFISGSITSNALEARTSTFEIWSHLFTISIYALNFVTLCPFDFYTPLVTYAPNGTKLHNVTQLLIFTKNYFLTIYYLCTTVFSPDTNVMTGICTVDNSYTCWIIWRQSLLNNKYSSRCAFIWKGF